MNLLQTIGLGWAAFKADVKGVVAKVVGGVVYLVHEGEVLGAAAVKADPALGYALLGFLHAGEQGAVALAKHEASGFGSLIDGSSSSVEQTIATMINNSGLSAGTKAELDIIKANVIAQVGGAVHAMVDQGIAKVAASLIPAPVTPAA